MPITDTELKNTCCQINRKKLLKQKESSALNLADSEIKDLLKRLVEEQKITNILLRRK
jgi:hypothetical protein